MGIDYFNFFINVIHVIYTVLLKHYHQRSRTKKNYITLFSHQNQCDIFHIFLLIASYRCCIYFELNAIRHVFCEGALQNCLKTQLISYCETSLLFIASDGTGYFTMLFAIFLIIVYNRFVDKGTWVSSFIANALLYT